MKPLKPSMRENKRYLLIKGKNLKENIEKAILDFVGILGYSKASPSFVKSGKDYVVLSINREAINEVRASFAVFSDEINIKKVSGTLKGLGK
jgi:RNase P/RNase MRP subunit POP5